MGVRSLPLALSWLCAMLRSTEPLPACLDMKGGLALIERHVMSERQQIAAAYARRAANPAIVQRESLLSPSQLFMMHQRERELVRQLRVRGMTAERLANCRILEVGCGRGGNLRRMIDFGVPAENLFGFDLLTACLRTARERCPQISVAQADGTAMPFRDGEFDIVLQSTTFSSLKNAETRRVFAAEMRRVLRPDGLILWFDFRVNNPWNPDVKAVTPGELRLLFPDCDCICRRTILAPPLTRRLCPKWPGLCELLARVPWLLTHYVASLRPIEGAS
jgi:SAM-dependent methyltransferase